MSASKRRTRPWAMMAAATVLALGAGAFVLAPRAQAETVAAPAALAGKLVRDADGKTLGTIEKAITNAKGDIRQVLVRTKKGPSSILRALPFSSLKAEGDGFVTVLTQAEYEAIPASPVE